MKKILSIAIVTLVIVAGGLYFVDYKSSSKIPLVTQPDGTFSSAYIPHGWTVVGNPATSATAIMFTSPDYLLENPATVDCKGEGCAQQVLGKGAYFQLAYNPCISEEGEAEFRQREQKNSIYLRGLVDQKPITIQGHKAVLFHTRSLTNTIHPAMEDTYHLTLVSAVKRAYCQDINFSFIESTTTNYGAEFQKFLDGLQFMPDKIPQR